MHDNNIQIRSEEVQEILTRIPHWIIRWGNLLIFILLFLILAMSWIVKYPDTITADIIITTETPPEKLIARSSGRLQVIFESNQKGIVKGTPLAVIENTADYADVFRLASITDTLQIDAENFKFPLERLGKLQLGDIASAFAIFESEYLSYRLNLDLHPYTVQGTALSNENQQLQRRLMLLVEQKGISENEMVLKKQELERFRKLHSKGVIASQEWDTKNLDYLQFEKNMRSLDASISLTRSSINELSKNVKTTKINQTKDQVNLFSSCIQSYNQLKKTIADWELNYVLRASITGTVSYLQVWKENQTVNQGENIFIIIPKETTSYIGKIKASALNAGKIKSGQKVNIRLANYPDREFGLLIGLVKYIALAPDKEGYLLVDVTLPDKLITTYNKEIAFQQEMSGSADIVTQDMRLLERLLYQFRDIMSREHREDNKKEDISKE